MKEIIQAESYYMTHPEHSYAIFCITAQGDLMMHTDYGQSNYAWRSFGDRTLDNFKGFLCDLSEDYWKSKMEYNLHFMKVPKRVISLLLVHAWPLFQMLQEEFRKQEPALSSPSPENVTNKTKI